jgi:hypothetical protein
MGLLDDAIREHLELKRRRGADPSEIAREEAEALGPVRREPTEPEPAETAEPVATAPAPEPHAGLEDPGAAYAEDFAEPAKEPRFEPEPATPPHGDRFEDHPVPSEPPATHEAPYSEEESETATPPHGDPLMHPASQPTREFSADELEEALAAEEPATDADPADEEGEDVLEETPDFLQETPEHDRLWFEQKPPKDFDF